MIRLPALVLLLAAWPLAGAETITARVSQTVAPVLEVAKPLLAKAHPEVTLAISGCPTPISIKAVATGEAQLGALVRDLKPEEKVANPDLVVTPIARDALVLVVNGANPVTALTRKQACDILTGTVTTWKEVGGSDAHILIVGRTEVNAINEFLEQRLGLEHQAEGQTMAFKAKGAAAFAMTPFHVTGTHKDALAQVMIKVDAFSFLPLGIAADKAQSGVIRILAYDGVKPDATTINDGTYTLGRTLYLLTRGEPAGTVKDIVDLIRSPEGQELVAGKGMIPLQ